MLTFKKIQHVKTDKYPVWVAKHDDLVFFVNKLMITRVYVFSVCRNKELIFNSLDKAYAFCSYCEVTEFINKLVESPKMMKKFKINKPA